jgi:hypothetical protein
MGEIETIHSPVPWSRTAMEWRQLIGSPYCDMTGTEKHVLTTMCRYGKKYGEDIFPSQRAVSFRSGVSLTYVSKIMKKAENLGWIMRSMIAVGHGRVRTQYKLSMPVGVEDASMFMKTRFWLPPYEYELQRTGGSIEMIKISDSI